MILPLILRKDFNIFANVTVVVSVTNVTVTVVLLFFWINNDKDDNALNFSEASGIFSPEIESPS